MKVDWKALSRSPGYMAFKKEMIRSRERSLSNNAEIYAKFRWAIGMAQHYAVHQNVPIDSVLIEWERVRQVNWANYYHAGNIPKLNHVREKRVSIPFYYDKKNPKHKKSTTKNRWTLLKRHRATYCRLIRAGASYEERALFQKRKKTHF